MDLRPGTPEALQEIAAESLASSVGAPITAAQKQILKDYMRISAHGAASAAPMVCQGTGCPFRSCCPLAQAQLPLPVGSHCPVERTMLQLWVNKHLDALGIKDALASEAAFDMDMLYEMAHLELIKWRAAIHLADDPTMIRHVQVAATQQGDPIFGDIIHPAIEIMEKAGKQVMKLRDALLATRKSQVDVGQRQGDPSVKTAEMVQKARERMKQRQEQQLRDAEVKEIR